MSTWIIAWCYVYIVNRTVDRRMIKFAEIVGGSEEYNLVYRVRVIRRQKVVSE